MKPANKDSRPIIVVRKRTKEHAAHHGGSWKVAYADFVTAMMAFFLVMWIMGMDQESRDLVQGYFNNPLGVSRTVPSGLNPVTSGEFLRVGAGSGVPASGILEQRARFEGVVRTLALSLGEVEFGDLGAAVEVVVTDEGLRIDLMEVSRDEVLFDRGASTVQPPLRRILAVVTPALQDLPHPVIVEGHTDRAPFLRPGSYGNWELSADRANAARRAMLEAGLPGSRVREVRGHADQIPRVPEDPYDPSNRRVTLIVPFMVPTPPPSLMELTSPFTPTASEMTR